MNVKKLLTLASVFVLLLIIAACGDQTSTSSGGNKKNVSENSGTIPGEVTYPVVTDGSITLTCWMPLSAAASKYMTSMNENPAWQAYSERTGIKVTFIHPTPGQEKEQFNLLIASNKLPDILYFPQAYSGGAFQGMRDGVFQDITGLLPVYAPDYYKIISTDKEFFREVSDNEGKIAAFCAYKPERDPPFHRIVLRGDILDKLGLGVPRTLNDYETMLEKMLAAGITPYLPTKNIYGVEVQLAGMFGIYAESTDEKGLTFMKDKDGNIKLGHIEPGFKDYLFMMNRWYKKGYISKDFTSVDVQQGNTLFDTGTVGMIVGPIVANYNRAQRQGFSVVSAPYPRLKEGDQLHFEFTDIWPNMNRRETTAVITKDCKNVEAAIQYMNYAYTDAGAELLNWGVEGVNWDWQDGKRVYNDTMLNNKMFGTEEASYIYKVHFSAKLNYPDVECHANLLKSPGALAIRKMWADDPDIDSLFQLPPFELSADAQERRAQIMTDVTTYCNEMVLKFIIGTEPIENFDKYVRTVKSMGIDEAIRLTQDAYNAYMSK